MERILHLIYFQDFLCANENPVSLPQHSERLPQLPLSPLVLPGLVHRDADFD